LRHESDGARSAQPRYGVSHAGFRTTCKTADKVRKSGLGATYWQSIVILIKTSDPR